MVVDEENEDCPYDDDDVVAQGVPAVPPSAGWEEGTRRGRCTASRRGGSGFGMEQKQKNKIK